MLIKPLQPGQFCELRIQNRAACWNRGTVSMYICTLEKLLEGGRALVRLNHNGQLLRVWQNQLS